MDDTLPAPQPRQGHSDQTGDAARAQAMMKRRTEGATWETIAEEFGYTNRSSPRQLVQRVLDTMTVETVDQYRELSNARLDVGLRALVPLIEDAKADPNVRIRAVDSLIRLEARRARLNGLDAPVKVEVSAGVQAELDDALRELRDALGPDDSTVPGEVVETRDDTSDGDP